MKIVLILPFRAIADATGLWKRARRKMAYAPTTLTTLAALVPRELGAEVEILDEGIDEVDVSRLEADLVGISVTTPSAPRAYRMAKVLRRRGIVVVLGGVHVTLVPDEAAEHADAIVVGYAERAWPALLADFRSGCLKRRYESDSAGLFDGAAPMVRHELLKKKRYFFPNSIEATRGCVNRCRFCVVPPFSRNRYCVRPVADVAGEILARGGDDWVFLDASPAERAGYARELYASLQALKIRWYSGITTRQLRDPDWLEQAAASGCRGVLVGFESLNQRSLQSVGKSFNEVDAYRQAVRRLHERGILVLGSFMFGFDFDDASVFQKTIDFVHEASIDLVHYAIFTPFPGTAAFEQFDREGRIATRDWSLYDCTRVVFRPLRMTMSELQMGYLRAYRETHRYAHIFKRVLSSRCSIRYSLAANLAFRLMGRIIERDVLESAAHRAGGYAEPATGR